MIRLFRMKHLLVAGLTAALATVGAERANADFHGAVGGLILGCATGLLNCNQKPQQQKRTTTQRPKNTMSAAQRQQNKDVQSALNAFNFPVGGVDGSLGPKSRSAIGNYQSYMGWGATGYLDDYQRNTLVDSYRKLQYGAGSAYPNMIAREGPRGLLRTALNPQYPAQYGDAVPGMNQNRQVAGGAGQVTAPVPQPAFPNTGTQRVVTPQVPVTTPQQPPQGGGQVISEPQQQTIAKLPQLNLRGVAPASVASRCELVELTSQAQGVIVAGNITDPNQALSEKFCDARSFAITQSQFKLSQISVSETEMAGSCGQIETAMSSALPGLATDTPQAALAKVSQIGTQLGLSDPGTAAIYGEICLGMGYRQDNAEMALTGALILTAAGRTPYGEIVGHHLREGFGVTKAADASVPWYNDAMGALSQGAAPAFEPSTTAERILVIRSALEQGGLRADVQSLPPLVPTTNVVLPKQ